MKRVAIFAHYDLKSEIDQYVIQYLRELKNYAETIIFVSDGLLSRSEIEKISDLVSDIICERHGEYDFGSYKRGFSLLKNKYRNELSEIDEVIITNDSCYCVNSFSKIFSEMEKTECDAWSLGDDYENGVDNRFYITKSYYLQSYFLVLRKSVFLEDFFDQFIQSITKLKYKWEIIFLYEEGFSRLLKQHNKKLFAFFAAKRIGKEIFENYIQETENLVKLIKETTIYANDDHALKIIGRTFDISQMNYVHTNKFYFLLQSGFPLLKRAIIDKNINTFDEEKLTFLWQEIVKKFTNFDVNLIKNHFYRIGKELKKADMIEIFENKKSNKTLSLNTICRLPYNKILNYKTFYQIKTTRSGNKIVKILRIPIFYKRTKFKKVSALKNFFNQAERNLSAINSNQKTLVIFAHFDKLDFIEEYVIDYLKNLREITTDIIFVSDTLIEQKEIKKIDHLVSKVISKKHGEYDFGSYKIGLLSAKDTLKNYDNLILANDSCYPAKSLKQTFDTMEARNSCDFWGITQNTEQFPEHIQSYFVAFKRNVFLHPEFIKFFESVTKEEKKIDVIRNYEVELTQRFVKLGFKKDSFIQNVFTSNPTLSEQILSEIKDSLPLIKTSIMNRFMWRNFKAKNYHQNSEDGK